MQDESKFRTAIKWSYAMNWARQGFVVLITLILARVLDPAMFGVVAIAAIYIGFIQMLMEQGLGTALIQRRNLRPTHLDSMFWAILMLSMILLALSIGFSGWWARMNRLPELEPVIILLSLGIPMRGLTIVQESLLRRRMNFRDLALLSSYAIVSGGVTGIVIALAGGGVWALVGQQLTTGVTQLFLLWRVGQWRPRFCFSLGRVRQLVSFSLWVFASKVGSFLSIRSDALLMGLFFGPVAVGLYRLSDRLMNLILQLHTKSIQMVALPHFSKSQNKREILRHSVKSCLRLSTIISLPMLASLAVMAHPLVEIIGPAWVDSADVLKVLCVIGAVKSLTLITGPLMNALGKPFLRTIIVWTSAIFCTISFVWVALAFGQAQVREQILAIAGVRTAVFTLIILPINLYILVKFGGLTFRDLLMSVGPACAGSGVAFVLVEMASQYPMVSSLTPIVRLMIEGVSIIAIASLTMILLDPSMFSDIKQFFASVPKMNPLTNEGGSMVDDQDKMIQS